jgi:hypothetical protein
VTFVTSTDATASTISETSPIRPSEPLPNFLAGRIAGMFGPIVEVVILAVAIRAVWRARARRFRWTIAEWFVVTFWICLVLAIVLAVRNA